MIPGQAPADVRLAPESGHWHMARKCSHRQDSQAEHASLDTMCQSYLRHRFFLLS